ncbi:hypothetical protein N234_17160 [Ralstonia pickettii DTP0602]|nr:hypothetical protein N234_17160 [Ralstonia pickettii DTP0602]
MAAALAEDGGLNDAEFSNQGQKKKINHEPREVIMKKKLLVAVLMVSAVQVQARETSTERLCQSIANAAESAAENRDIGVPLSKMIKAVDEAKLPQKALTDATKRMVRVIYDTPAITPAMARSAYLDGCLKGMR